MYTTLKALNIVYICVSKMKLDICFILRERCMHSDLRRLQNSFLQSFSLKQFVRIMHITKFYETLQKEHLYQVCNIVFNAHIFTITIVYLVHK